MARSKRLDRSLLWPVAMLLVLSGCRGAAPPIAAPMTAAPVSSTVAAPPDLGETFTSALYAYSVAYPSSFSSRSATENLEGTAPPFLGSDAIDQLSSPGAGPAVEIALASAAVSADMKLDAWTAATARAFCGTPTASEKVTLDAEPANLDTFESCEGLFHQWVTAVHDGRGYHVVWVNRRGTEAADRAQFLEMLETFEFGASRPSPVGSPAAAAPGLRPLEPGDAVPDALLG